MPSTKDSTNSRVARAEKPQPPTWLGAGPRVGESITTNPTADLAPTFARTPPKLEIGLDPVTATCHGRYGILRVSYGSLVTSCVTHSAGYGPDELKPDLRLRLRRLTHPRQAWSGPRVRRAVMPHESDESTASNGGASAISRRHP